MRDREPTEEELQVKSIYRLILKLVETNYHGKIIFYTNSETLLALKSEELIFQFLIGDSFTPQNTHENLNYSYYLSRTNGIELELRYKGAEKEEILTEKPKED